MENNIKNEILSQLGKQDINLRNLLELLLNNDELKDSFTNDIRRFTTIGNITNCILSEQNLDQKCRVLAIGDIKYSGKNKEKWESILSDALKNIDISTLSGYDLSGLGNKEFRKSLFEYMENYYDFNIIENDIVENIIPCYGATDGFVNIIDTFKGLFPDKKIKFIYPEASFLANVKIAEDILGEDNVLGINKNSKDDFFFPENMENIVENNSAIVNLYYITSIGNPTGEKLDNNKLYNIINNILNYNKNAYFIFDNVYVGLLKNTISKEMFTKIFSNKNLMNKIVFLESLSKTLGTTGIRIGWTWTLNKSIDIAIKRNVVLKKAGFSKILSELSINLFSNMENILDFQEDIFKDFSDKRLEFLGEMKNNYSDLFDFDNIPGVLDREGIYLLLKVKEGISIEDVFIKTGVIGVGINLSDGLYVRYSFGNI